MAERIVCKEMGLTPAQFRRTLPNAAGPGARISERDGGLGFLIEWLEGRGGRVCISLQPQPDRRIASIALPVTRVELCFEGMDAAAAEAFLRRFDLYYQKGGG